VYGLIHLCLREMLSEHLGARAWERVCQDARLDPGAVILTSQLYDDDVTFSLIKASAVEFYMPFDDFMEEFGKSWVRYVSSNRYCGMLKASGGDLESLIRNLDGLHQAVSSTLISARIGSFKIRSSGPGWLIVRYDSARVGLERFVVGLMNGLLIYFDLLGSAQIISYDDRSVEVLLNYQELS